MHSHTTLFPLIFFGEHAPGPLSLNLTPLSPVNPQTHPPWHPLALKLVYGPEEIFGSYKPICLKVED